MHTVNTHLSRENVEGRASARSARAVHEVEAANSRHLTRTQTTHDGAETGRGSLYQKHTGFHAAEATNLAQNPCRNNDRGGESSVPGPTTLLPCQNAIPFQPSPLPFIGRRGEAVTSCLHHLYSLSLRTEIHCDFLDNK